MGGWTEPQACHPTHSHAQLRRLPKTISLQQQHRMVSTRRPAFGPPQAGRLEQGAAGLAEPPPPAGAAPGMPHAPCLQLVVSWHDSSTFTAAAMCACTRWCHCKGNFIGHGHKVRAACGGAPTACRRHSHGGPGCALCKHTYPFFLHRKPCAVRVRVRPASEPNMSEGTGGELPEAAADVLHSPAIMPLVFGTSGLPER